MPKLLAIAGLRPDPAVTGPLDEVVCPPYDIISEGERLELLGRSPYNIVRLELPNGRYQEAARLLHEWTSMGALAREKHPALYGYRMSYISAEGEPRQTLGVIGALVLEPPGQGILPHEETTPKAKSDRLELIRATEANTSPIWCLCPERGLTDALGEPPGNDGDSDGAGPIASAQDDEGTLHEIWPVFSAEIIDKVAKVVQAKPLLVADGHHRYETALAYQAERRQAAPIGAPTRELAGYDAVLALVVELSEQHLQVMAIHRLVSGLPAGFDILGALEAAFELSPTSIEGPALLAEMVTAGALAVLLRSGHWLAKPRPAKPRAAKPRPAKPRPAKPRPAKPRPEGPLADYDLDSSRIDAALRTLPAHHLAYEHDPAQAEAAVAAGEADAALLCRPATVRQIARTAHGGGRMPPKTTFFWPKPRTGMVLRAFGTG
jgi:uncharacterized protein (DUF1015 family)